MINRYTLLLVAVLVAVIGLAGCQTTKTGSSEANQPPTTVLTHAPDHWSVVNHYIPINWAGNDADGTVVGYLVVVGDSTGPTDSVITTANDTTIAFADVTDSVQVFHTIEVRAIDNEGAMSPVTKFNADTFYTVNYTPVALFFESGSVPPNVNVGAGFRMTLRGADPNPSYLTFCVAIDTAANWVCSSDSIFLFGSSTLDVLPDHSTLVPNNALTPGHAHTIYAKVVDAGGAASAVISRTLNVVADQVPTMDTTVVGIYAGQTIYPDGSVYFVRSTETRLTWTASAALYHGEINAYRHQIGDTTTWSAWASSSTVALNGLPAGDYRFIVEARDLAATLTAPDTFILHIVEQNLTSTIVIVDETRDGTGARGSPNDAQVDAFYDAMFAGTTTVPLDYNSQGFVSPMNLKDAGVVMWHADDKSDEKLGSNTRILGEFLNNGGRLILSGWDVMGPLSATADSIYFGTGAFGYTKLHLQWAVRNRPRTTTGFSGYNNYPGCAIDTAKVPASWAGTMDQLWTVRPRGEDIVIGRLTVSDPDVNPLVGQPAAYIYDLSFRVAVFGVPLYFCYQDQVYNLLRNPTNDPAYVGIVNQMLTGLTPG